MQLDEQASPIVLGRHVEWRRQQSQATPSTSALPSSSLERRHQHTSVDIPPTQHSPSAQAQSIEMSNPLDSAPGSELFSNYEAELQLIQADLSQTLDSAPSLSGEPRKAALARADRSLDEAHELLASMRLEKPNIPAPHKAAINKRLRDHESDIDALKRKIASLRSDKAALFGQRYRDHEGGGAPGDEQLEQRQQLLSGTDRLERSSGRLRESQRIALETEDIGRNTLADLGRQRETIEHTRGTLLESEGYTDRSNKTLRGMARRWVPSLW